MAQQNIIALSISAPIIKNGTISQNAILQTYLPKAHFGGGTIKWYEDKPQKLHIKPDGCPVMQPITSNPREVKYHD